LEYHLDGSRLKRLGWLIASVWPNIIRTKVAHLGAELRELAERKATEFNLAIKYIEKQ
jgi:hypothetical protein